MSHRRRRDKARFGKVTSRPKVRGRTRQETRDRVLELAGHRCAWCGGEAALTAPRCRPADRSSVCWNAAWCGTCDPDIGKIGMGPPSRLARPDPGSRSAQKGE